MELLEAAQRLCGVEPSQEAYNISLRAGSTSEEAAIVACGNKATPKLVEALKALVSGGITIPKNHHPVQKPAEIAPGNTAAVALAQKLSQNLDSFKPAHLNGKHVQNSFFLSAEGQDWLIKTDPDPGPVLGEKEERVGAPVREAAFHDLAVLFGLHKYIAETRLLYVDGKQAAAIQFLPQRDWQPIQDAMQENTASTSALIENLRLDGLLFRFSVLDYVAGNGDRHGHNILTTDKHELKLIDHGSSMAGPSFHPGIDPNAFVPYYLRSKVSEQDFHQMKPAQKLQVMPSLPTWQIARAVQWLRGLLPEKIDQTLRPYGIDPKPIVDRLVKIQTETSPSQAAGYMNRIWIS